MQTVREFVRDLAMRGRSNSDILAVACAVKSMQGQMKEVEYWVERRAKRWRHLGWVENARQIEACIITVPRNWGRGKNAEKF